MSGKGSGSNLYKRPHFEGSVYDGRDNLELSGDLTDSVNTIIQKFGLPFELVKDTSGRKRR